MPDPGLAPFTTVFRTADPHRVKRNRQAVSCTACQRRKSKCDRRQPCNACEKRGGGEACRFSSSSSASPGSGGGSVGRKEVQMRLSRLEEMVKGLADRKPSAGREPEHLTGGGDEGLPLRERDRSAEREAAVGAGHGHEADFHGATSWTALVDSIHDIQALLAHEDAPDASDAGEEAEPAGCDEPDVMLGDVAPMTAADLTGSLPARAEADRLVRLYFNAKFIAVPFLHAHHFRRRYEAFWEAPAAAPLLWVSILFSVLAAGATVARVKDPEAPAPETGPETAAAAGPRTYAARAARCLVAGKYLRTQPYSVEALLMHAHCRHVQRLDSDSTLWAMYGLAVRLAQKSGFHRDAARVGLRASPFEAEMRRRTWFSAQSSDMLFSFQHGMPSMIDDDACDAGHPTNLTDEDFDEGSAALPPPRPATDPTPILAYVAKSSLCRLVRRVMRHALCTSPVAYAETRALHEALEAWHEAIPACLRVRPIRSTAFTDANYTIMHRLMLEIMYLKTLCVLHRPYLTLADAGGGGDDDERQQEYRTSRQLCRDAANRLLELHIEFDQEIRPHGRMYEDRYMVTSLTYHHFLLAAMVLCLDLSESTDLTFEDRSSRVRLLHTIHAIWSARSASSLDAAHASRVLRAIIAKVDTPPSLTSSSSPAMLAPDESSSGTLSGTAPSLGKMPLLAQDLAAEGGAAAAEAGHVYAVNFDEMLPLDGFFSGGEGVDWNSLDHFLRIDHSNTWDQPLTDFPL